MFFVRQAIILSCLFTTSVFAATQPITKLYFNAESGWSNMANGRVAPYQFKDKKHFGYRAAMGYLFKLNTNLSLGPEVGYGYYGLISYVNPTGLVASYESTGWSVLANLKYAALHPFNLYLKAGLTTIYQQYDIAGPNVTPGGFYERRVSPTVVLAGAYHLSEHVELGLSYTHIFANRAPLSGNAEFTFTNVDRITSVDAVMVGVVYNV